MNMLAGVDQLLAGFVQLQSAVSRLPDLAGLPVLFDTDCQTA